MLTMRSFTSQISRKTPRTSLWIKQIGTHHLKSNLKLHSAEKYSRNALKNGSSTSITVHSLTTHTRECMTCWSQRPTPNWNSRRLRSHLAHYTLKGSRFGRNGTY